MKCDPFNSFIFITVSCTLGVKTKNLHFPTTYMKKQLFLHLLPSTLHPSFQDFQFLRCFLWHLFTIIFLSKMLLSNIWIYRFSWLSVDFWKYTSAIWRVSIFFEHSSILVISWFPKIEVIQFAFSAFLTAVVQECNLEFLNQMLLLKF